MQAQARTPNSILRKRLNKENEEVAGKLAKRNRLANRRVSFAPDEELETKHIFKEDSRDDRNSTGDLRLGSPVDGLTTAAGVVNSQVYMNPRQYTGQHPGDPPAVPPSPSGLSPLSMDLTNNSIDQQGLASAAMLPGYNAGRNGASLGGPALPPVQQRHQQMEYTRNITMNVPNLSTLVEEDEEEYAAADGDGGGAGDTGTSASPRGPESPGLGPGLRFEEGGEGQLPPVSPISPFVLREMQRGRVGDGEDDEVRNRWGFTPGADDTLEVSYGRAVMGETTYNHVYGAATTGELTKAIKDGHTGGNQIGHPGAVTRALATITAARVPAILGGDGSADAGAGGSVPAMAAGAAGRQAQPRNAGLEAEPGTSAAALPAQAARQPAQQVQPIAHPKTQALQLPLGLGPHMMPPPAPLPHNTPYMDNTTKLLEDDQTDAWRLPGYDRGRLSVASNKVQPPGYRRGAPVDGGKSAAGGETTMLLGGTTQLLATGNMNTAQLLADTTDHKAAYDRFLRNMPGRQAPPSAAPVPRPGLHVGLGEATAVSSSAAELRRLTAHDNTSMSLDLPGAEGNGTSNDLLGDNGGLSLDAFALPPEPTVNLAAQGQGSGAVQRQAQAEREGACGQADGLLLGRAAGAYAAAAPAPARPAVQEISCQEFLSLIDVSFNDKVCRSSYLPQSDPPPKTVAEIYEAAVTTAPHVDIYNEMQIEVGGRLVNMQSRVQQLEGELTASNPEFFAAVQLAPAAQVETIKEQFISLKKLCRIRTVKAIKQTHLNSLDKLISRLDTSKMQLQAEVAAMTADMERFNCCVQDKNILTAAIARRCQEDEERMQESIQRKKAVEGHLQRLEELRAQNAQRLRRMEEAQAERQLAEQSRVPKDVLAQERSTLEARSAALVSRACSSALTPGRESQMARQVTMKREEVEAVLGLHALRIDLMGMENTGRFTLLFGGTYHIACTSTAGSCHVGVDGPIPTAKLGSLSPSIISQLRATAGALSCRIPRAQLALRLEAIVEQLSRMRRLAHQLEACWLKHNSMQKPEVEDRGFDGRPALLLQFLNADTVTKVSIRMPWQAALQSDFEAPSLRVQMNSLESEDTQRQYCDALHNTVLSKLSPSSGFMSALCFAMSVTLQVPSDAGQSTGSDSAGDTITLSRTPMPLPPSGEEVGRVFDNPLFTSPTMEVGRL